MSRSALWTRSSTARVLCKANHEQERGEHERPVCNAICWLQYQAIAAKVNRVGRMSRHLFQQSLQLLWPTFQYYMAPTLLFCSPAWRPYLRKDNCLTSTETFTRSIWMGWKNWHTFNRLTKLNALTVDSRMMYADMALIYKSLHGI